MMDGHAAEDDLGGQAVKDILGGHAAKDDLDGQAAKDDLGDHAVKDDLGSHAAEDDLNTTLIPGDLIWTKVGKHPFWPSMITYDPADGAYKKLTKSKGKNETIYHVQFFGTVQRGWTSPGSSFLFRGKNAYWEKVQLLEKTNPNIGPKSLKKLKLKYDVPLSAKNKWTVAVKEADEALKCLDQKERFETYVYKYNIKKKSLPKGKVAAKISAQSSKMKLSNISDEVCDICFGNNVDIFCTGKCSKFFHMACLGLFKKPSMFKCPTCYSGGISAASTEFTSVPVTLLSPTTVSPPELIAATVAPRELESTKLDLPELEPESISIFFGNAPSTAGFTRLFFCFICKTSDGILHKCNDLKCKNHFHDECLAKYEKGMKSKRTCSRHICYTCEKENPKKKAGKGQLVQCIKCPAAFHYRENCIPAGSVKKSEYTIICPFHYGGKKGSSTLKIFNMNHCNICGTGGKLVCCESCPNAFHESCLNAEIPENEYICEDCTSRKYLVHGMIVWNKIGHYRWWPSQIIHPSYIPNNVKNMKHSDGEFCIRYFGHKTYSWAHRGCTYPYVEKDKHTLPISAGKFKEKYNEGLKDAAKAYDEFLANRVSDSLSDAKPDKYMRIRVNHLKPPVRAVTADENVISPCACDSSEQNPCGTDSGCLNRSMQIECHPNFCRAKELCQNQNFQKKNNVPTIPFKTVKRGWGLIALEDIKKGQFVIEYVGEVITHKEYEQRKKAMQANNKTSHYFLYLDSRRIIDAAQMGNNSRFINHSCNPNCEMQKWEVNGDSRIGIFAIQDIPSGDELTFNYQSNEFKQKCYCYASNCTGTIGKPLNKARFSATTDEAFI